MTGTAVFAEIAAPAGNPVRAGECDVDGKRFEERPEAVAGQNPTPPPKRSREKTG